MKIILTSLTFCFFIFGMAQSQDLKDLPIEIQLTTTSKTYVTMSTGETETKSRVRYQYRYEGDEKWLETGGAFLNIQPILERFESSKLLFESSLQKRRLVIPFVAIGIVGLSVSLFSSMRPQFDKSGNSQDKRWGLVIGSGVAGLAGCLTAGFLRDSGIELALDAVQEYNRLIKEL